MLGGKDAKSRPLQSYISVGDYIIDKQAIITRSILTWHKQREVELLKGLKADIQEEINSRPKYPNIGKKGCIKRIQKLIDERMVGK